MRCDADYRGLCLMGSFSYHELRATEFVAVRSSLNLLAFLTFPEANELLL